MLDGRCISAMRLAYDVSKIRDVRTGHPRNTAVGTNIKGLCIAEGMERLIHYVTTKRRTVRISVASKTSAPSGDLVAYYGGTGDSELGLAMRSPRSNQGFPPI